MGAQNVDISAVKMFSKITRSNLNGLVLGGIATISLSSVLRTSLLPSDSDSLVRCLDFS